VTWYGAPEIADQLFFDEHPAPTGLVCWHDTRACALLQCGWMQAEEVSGFGEIEGAHQA